MQYKQHVAYLPAWWNGRHKRLKISGLSRPCRFESGRGYHVLGDFSFNRIGCEFTPNFVYLFMYPFVDGYVALWHARAHARVVILLCVSAVAGGVACAQYRLVYEYMNSTSPVSSSHSPFTSLFCVKLLDLQSICSEPVCPSISLPSNKISVASYFARSV